MLILGLDASSACLGYALLDGAAVERFGHYDIPDADIARRCHKARLWTIAALATYRPVLVVLENPAVSRNPVKSTIAQLFVRGAILGALAEHDALWDEVSPASAALALTGRGVYPKGQRKPAVLRAAGLRLGIPGEVRRAGKKFYLAAVNGKPILTEDEADAIAVAVAGLDIKVDVLERSAA